MKLVSFITWPLRGCRRAFQAWLKFSWRDLGYDWEKLQDPDPAVRKAEIRSQARSKMIKYFIQLAFISISVVGFIFLLGFFLSRSN